MEIVVDLGKSPILVMIGAAIVTLVAFFNFKVAPQSPPLIAFVVGFFVPTWYPANLKRQKEERAEEQARQGALDDGG